MIITHNLSAMQTNRNLNLNNKSVSKSLEKLSSGYRINVGADDPSGLIISEQLRSQMSGVSRAIQNTSEASNLIGLTEGALSEMNEILKKMRALAIHAANNGVTSPEQVKADQAEVDSGIATIQRIADTTRYSDQFVLNGSKQLVYDRTTQVKTTMDHTLIDVEGSRVDQIFKRSGVSMSFSYAGVDGDGYVNNASEAKRAYFEVDSVQPDPHQPGAWIRSEADITKGGVLTADQEFVLSGTKGTKLFKFTTGQTLGQMAQSINNSKDSLGVGATLTFSADARVDSTVNGTYPVQYLDWSNADPLSLSLSTTVTNPGDPYDPISLVGGFATAGGNTLRTNAATMIPDVTWDDTTTLGVTAPGSIAITGLPGTASATQDYDVDITFAAKAGITGEELKAIADAIGGAFANYDPDATPPGGVQYDAWATGSDLVFTLTPGATETDDWALKVTKGTANGPTLGTATVPSAGGTVELEGDLAGLTLTLPNELAFDRDNATQAFTYTLAAGTVLAGSVDTRGAAPDWTGAGPATLTPFTVADFANAAGTALQKYIPPAGVSTSTFALSGGPLDAAAAEALALALGLETKLDGTNNPVIELTKGMKFELRQGANAAGNWTVIVSSSTGQRLGAATIDPADDTQSVALDGLLTGFEFEIGTAFPAFEYRGAGTYEGALPVSGMTLTIPDANIAPAPNGPQAIQAFESEIAFEGTLVNPNDLANRLGVAVANPNDPASVGLATKDMHFTLVQPLKDGDQWTLSVGTSAGANDLGDILCRPDTNPLVAFSTGPLAGLTLDLGGLLVRDPENTEPYTCVVPGEDIQFSRFDYKPAAIVNDHRQAGEVQIYGADINGGADKMKVTGVNVRNGEDFRVGMNCDGDGRVYAKVTKFVNDQDYEVEWYKDAACTMLIGSSPKPNVFSATNNSGIANGGLTIALTNNAAVGDLYTVGLVGQEFALARDSDGYGGLDQPADFDVQGIGGWQGMSDASLSRAVVSGVRLGFNTSQTGDLFFKAEGPPEARVVNVYTSANHEPESLVATGTADLSADGQRVIRLEEVTMENGQRSGLNMTLPFSDAVTSRGTETGQISFVNVALRLYSTDYGSEEYVNIQQKTGTLFHQYRYHDTLDRTYVEPGTTVRTYGQDALLALNGFPIRTTGVVANVTTADFQGKIALSDGELGQTTVATAGYEVGSLYSRAGALQGVAENETDMRSVALSQGYEIQPPRTYVGNDKGVVNGLTASGVKDSGQLQFDFSRIDTAALDAVQLANLEAAMANGMTVEYASGDVAADGTTTGMRIAVHYVDKDGVTRTLDIGSGRTHEGNVSANAMTEIAFTTLNSADGLAVPAGAQAGSAPFNFAAGLVIKGNAVNNSADISSAPRTVYSLQANLLKPEFEALTEVVTYATNARHATTETLDNFIGGMQFQLGGNEGDQDRTVYSIPSMVMANLGRLEIDGRIYTLQDVLGSSDASLIADPILAMQIIAQAVDDVSTLRGRLGAFQANMLATNENSLNIAVEMLAKTESAIRDTDMAAESTEFTKNQILVQAGTAMLAQANQLSQNVLQLLG